MELYVCAHSALDILESAYGIVVKRCVVGVLMSALEMPGVRAVCAFSSNAGGVFDCLSFKDCIPHI